LKRLSDAERPSTGSFDSDAAEQSAFDRRSDEIRGEEGAQTANLRMQFVVTTRTKPSKLNSPFV
jgi:hypothetical protein